MRFSGSFGLCRFRDVEQLRQVAAAIDDALNTHRSGYNGRHGCGDNSEEDNIVAQNGQPRSLANFGTNLIEERMLADFDDLLPDLPYEGNCSLRIVFGDEISNGFEIAFDKAR